MQTYQKCMIPKRYKVKINGGKIPATNNIGEMMISIANPYTDVTAKNVSVGIIKAALNMVQTGNVSIMRTSKKTLFVPLKNGNSRAGLVAK